MERRYGLSSEVWRSLRDGDFEEADIWAVVKDRTGNPNTKVGRSRDSSVSVPANVPTAARMIPRASRGSFSGGSSGGNSSCHESKIVQQSAPVNIPDWPNIYRQKPNKVSKNASFHDDDDDDDDDGGGFVNDGGDSEDDYDDDDEYDDKVPPHEFIARRLARSQISSFSVFEGVGRTLKGRDLSKVRNAVLSKTGFLESL